jgi:amino acid adenylation domain-containing protein
MTTTAITTEGKPFPTLISLDQETVSAQLLTSAPESNDPEVEYQHPALQSQKSIAACDSPWVSMTISLPGNVPFSLERLNWTWQALASHNPCLRTHLWVRPYDGKVFHRVLRRVTSPLPLSNLLPLQAARMKTAFLIYRPDSIGQKAAPSVTMCIPHMLVDPTSLGMLKVDLGMFYCGLPLKEHSLFRSYIEHVQTKDDERSHRFWRETLADIDAAPLLLLGQLTSTSHATRRQIVFQADEQIQYQLSRFKITSGYEWRLLFEAVWAIVLSRHGDSSRVIFATSGRDNSFKGKETCIGLLDNVYPVKIELEESINIDKVLDGLQRYHRAASVHSHLGFERIMNESSLKIQSYIGFTSSLDFPLTSSLPMSCPLQLLINGADKLRFTLRFDDAVGDGHAEVLLNHFTELVMNTLSRFESSPIRIDELEMASASEASKSLSLGRSLVQQRDGNLVDMFREQVALHSEDPAVQFEDERSITFGELNLYANIIAQSTTIRKGTIIPICMDRSPALIACIWAILKSGAAYVILDPDGAVERNAFIVREVEAEIVLVDHNNARTFTNGVVVDNLLERNDLPSLEENSVHEIDSSSPAYIVYTSGSTGKPKGVVLSHGAAVNGILNNSLSRGTRLLLFYNPIFSAAQRAILATLLNGGCLCLARKERLLTSLDEVLNKMKIEAVGLTPSSLSLLQNVETPYLKQIAMTGEAVDADIVETWAARVDLRNSYGLSECTQLNFGRSLTPSSNPRVVGRPKDTTSVFILSPGTDCLAPIGIPGEICLAGPQLGSGYLKRHEHTAKSFIQNPFGEGKLYRTGDIGLQHPNGDIEILGRKDFQVKIAGQRVELKEIGAVLNDHPHVSAVAVIAAEIDGIKSLVAAIVPSRDIEWSLLLAELRRKLKTSLPAYMHPSYWLPYENMPQNQNDKTDVRSIQRRAQEQGRAGLLKLMRGFQQPLTQAPMTSTELILRNTWAQILNIEPESIQKQDTFANLGGNSMQAIRVVVEIRKAGLLLELSDIFSGQCISELALHVVISLQPTEDLKPYGLLDEPFRSSLIRDGGVDDAYPLTPLQESLVAATLTGNTNYIYQRVFNVGHLELHRLKAAFATVFHKRDIYRTTFQEIEGHLVQIVRNDMELPWIETNQGLEDYKREDLVRGVALGSSFFRVAVLQQTYLVVTMHHALFDFWSHKFLYQDVSALYQSEKLPERPLFRNFVGLLQRLDQSKQQGFWSEYLSAAEKTTLNHAPTGRRIAITKQVPISLSRDCAKLGLTAGAVVYAAWAILLARHTGGTDVCFATTYFGREVSVDDVAEMDGPTLTTVPQRIFVDPESPVIDIATKARDNLWPVIRNSQFGMRRALSAAGHGRNLCDTLVNFLVEDLEAQRDHTQIFRPHGPKPIWQSDYTTLELQEKADSLVVSLSSDMEESRASFVLEQFFTILHYFFENPSSKTAAIDILSPTEHAALQDLAKFSSPKPMMLHERFERIAEESPDLTALEWSNQNSLTYKQLHERSNQLAHYLVERGVSRGQLVPLYLEKSFDAIVAMLAVLKAGAAYVPLSPSNPVERNSYILVETEAQLMISVKGLLPGQTFAVEIVFLDEIDFALYPKTSHRSNATTTDLAYIIYTSGSTGLPKGVKVPHHAGAAAVGSMLDAEGRDRSTWRTIQFANYVFDASVQDIFNTLSSGGTLCMADSDEMLSNLAGVINKMDVRQAILTPTVARMISPEDVPGFETLILGGEPMTRDIIQAWRPRCRLLNVYGPTETSMVVTTKEMAVDSAPGNIGKPFPTVSTMVLEPNSSRFVPYGAIGELCIAGPQVADGYLKKDDLTALNFIKGDQGQTYYRTGDLVRWLPGGELECLGRKDNQVKIAGHRIELGEIEQAMLSSAVVEDCAALVIQSNGKPHLAAFVVYEHGQESLLCDTDDCSKRLEQLKGSFRGLAHYMVPKYVFPFGVFPLLPSRKTDRRQLRRIAESIDPASLPQYSIDRLNTDRPTWQPTVTEEESFLEAAWGKLFNVDRSQLGAKADFFALGGDSISAINLVSLCRSSGYAIQVSEVMNGGILDEMARCLRKVDDLGTTTSLKTYMPPPSLREEVETVGLSMDDIETVFPCPPGQVEFLNQGRRPDQLWVLMTTRAVSPSLDVQEWIACITELTRVNNILRSTFVHLEGHGWLSVVLKSDDLDLSIHKCAAKDKDDIIERELWQYRFEFGRPFIRYLILELEGGVREIAIKMDHALYDGTLLRIFAEHFSAIQQHKEIPKHIEFSEFALYHWRANKAKGLEFWKSFLDRYSFQYPNKRESRITSFITHPIDIKIDRFINACKITAPILFQSAFQLWLAKASSSLDVGFDYLLTGRNVELEDPQAINGNCAQFLPFRSRIDPRETLQSYAVNSQADFWKVTEHSSHDLDTIFAAAGHSSIEFRNRSLFLFQPFEPSSGAAPEDAVQWVVMKGSKVRMYQPYALVMEISKTMRGYLMKVMFDESAMSETDAASIGCEMERIVQQIVGADGSAQVDSILHGSDPVVME